MKRRAAACLLVLAGATLMAGAFEPRARPLRHRLPSAAAQNTLRRSTTVGQAELLQQRRDETLSAAMRVRAQLLVANSRYEAWVLGGQADAGLYEQVITALRQVRTIKPDLVLDEQWVPPKLIELWNETR